MAALQLPAEHEMSDRESLLEAPWPSRAGAAGKPLGHEGEPPPCPERSPPGLLLLPHSQLGGHRPRDDGIAQQLRELPGKTSPSRVNQVMWGNAGD